MAEITRATKQALLTAAAALAGRDGARRRRALATCGPTTGTSRSTDRASAEARSELAAVAAEQAEFAAHRPQGRALVRVRRAGAASLDPARTPSTS